MTGPKVLPLGHKVVVKAQKLGVSQKLDKKIRLFEQNPFHRSLNTELLEPKSVGIWSFRVDIKIRAIFIWRGDKKAIEILNLTVHYR